MKTEVERRMKLNWFDRLEKRVGKYAIPNLTGYIVGCYIVGFIVLKFMPGMLGLLILEPSHILRGEVWRIVTWIFVPISSHIVYLVLMSFLYYSLGRTLELTWGRFRYNIYIFSGIIFTVIGAFIAYAVMGGGSAFVSREFFFTTEYVNLSIFLAFAASFPDMQLMIYFIVPIKVKWLASLYAAFVLYSFVVGSVPCKIAILASLLNFLLFYLILYGESIRLYMRRRKRSGAGRTISGFRTHHVHPEQGRHKSNIQKMPQSGKTIHRCAVCGRTSETNPELEFRYCSKCNGNYEYCQDHLFSHEHVK